MYECSYGGMNEFGDQYFQAFKNTLLNIQNKIL
jgi:hypothetical protein